MLRKTMQRAERAAARRTRGPELLEAIRNASEKLVEATSRSRPAVAAISEELSQRFGGELQDKGVRQFVGIAVRAVMEEAGYEPAQNGVHLAKDPIFRVGTVYRKRQIPVLAGASDALERMLKALSYQQAEFASAVLTEHFGLARSKQNLPPVAKSKSKAR